MINLLAFTTDLRNSLKDNMPRESDTLAQTKHKKRPLHMRDVAFSGSNNQPMLIGTNMYAFEFGNENAERDYPYYHILEDAEVIYKKGKGTTTSKGSQASISDLGKRDYGIVKVNANASSGKSNIYTEYRKNVRGSRSRIGNAQRSYGNGIIINRGANYYYNKHYHYIEKILDGFLCEAIAEKYGLRRLKNSTDNFASEIDYQNEQMFSGIRNSLSNRGFGTGNFNFFGS